MSVPPAQRRPSCRVCPAPLTPRPPLPPAARELLRAGRDPRLQPAVSAGSLCGRPHAWRALLGASAPARRRAAGQQRLAGERSSAKTPGSWGQEPEEGPTVHTMKERALFIRLWVCFAFTDAQKGIESVTEGRSQMCPDTTLPGGAALGRPARAAAQRLQPQDSLGAFCQ